MPWVDSPKEDKFYLFCYGSMKRGYQHHQMLGDAVYLGVFETEPNYLLYDTGPYPGMIEVKESEGRCIEGELYSITQPILAQIQLKVPLCFTKKEIKIKSGQYPLIQSHIYEWCVDRFLDCGTSWPRT